MARKDRDRAAVATTMTHRWMVNGPDSRLLIKMMSNGEITESDTPKGIRDSTPEFQKYNETQFRGAWARTKTLTGLHVRKGKLGKRVLLLLNLLFVIV